MIILPFKLIYSSRCSIITIIPSLDCYLVKKSLNLIFHSQQSIHELSPLNLRLSIESIIPHFNSSLDTILQVPYIFSSVQIIVFRLQLSVSIKIQVVDYCRQFTCLILKFLLMANLRPFTGV